MEQVKYFRSNGMWGNLLQHMRLQLHAPELHLTILTLPTATIRHSKKVMCDEEGQNGTEQPWRHFGGCPSQDSVT